MQRSGQIWRGAGAIFEVLAPVIGGTVAGAADANQSAHADEVYLGSDSAGRLEDLGALSAVAPPHGDDATPTGDRAAARLVERLSTSAIVVELLV